MFSAMKARGCPTNPKPRFDRLDTQACDDGWDLAPDEAPPPATEITIDKTRSIITRNDSSDVPFDQSINPYRGCEHGCPYCFARPSHAYLGLSPGLDFETRLFAKPEAPSLLDKELRNPRYRCRIIAIGTNTDPYQPIENRYRIMRGCLEVLSAFQHPVSIVTKGALVTRDIDLLGPMAERKLAVVGISLTTLNRDLSRRLEPRAAPPAARLEAIRRLSAAGIPVVVMVAPIIPALTDHELEAILAAARRSGATMATHILLRLPNEVADLFARWLDEHFPDKARHVMSLVSQSRGGKAYDSTWGTRMSGTGPHAEMLAQRFKVAAARLGLTGRILDLDTTRFRPPPKAGDQLALF